MAEEAHDAGADILQALAQAKGMLTRRTRAFTNLLAGNQSYTRQTLVKSRENMITACENMVAELDQYVDLGLDLNHAGYLDGRRRQQDCMFYYRDIYEARLADFVHQDSLAESEHYTISERNPQSNARSAVKAPNFGPLLAITKVVT